jgi:hypothetical protein
MGQTPLPSGWSGGEKLLSILPLDIRLPGGGRWNKLHGLLAGVVKSDALVDIPTPSP